MKTQINLPKFAAQFISASAIIASGMFMLASCSKDNSTEPSAQFQSVSNHSGLRTDPPVITMSKSKCDAGDCSVFDFQVYIDGQVIYNGYSNVGKIGHIEFYVDKNNVAALAQFANDQGFFKLRDTYTVLPGKSSTTTFARFKQVKKTVVDYGSADVPANLIMMKQTFLDKLGISPMLVIPPPVHKVAISIKHDGAAGQFPEYNVTLFDDGKMVYEGLGGLPSKGMGKSEQEVGTDIVNELVEAAKALGFPQMKDVYPFSPDQDGVQTSILIDSDLKTVLDYNTPEVPEALRDLKIKIEDRLNIREFTHL